MKILASVVTVGFLLLGGVIPTVAKAEGGVSLTPVTIKKAKLVAATPLTEQASEDLVVVEPVAAPIPPTPAVGVSGCGSDPNLAYIYQHESGCRTNAIGPNGPCGLGQALPCSKMPCSLSDWDCQNTFFTGYAIARYGSTAAAYQFWLGHSWW